MTENVKKKRPYLYEVDFLRVIFILGVLLNHTTSLVGDVMQPGSWEVHFLNATHLSLHFTRMGFMFITGLVLFLNYYGRDLDVWKFWQKRYWGVGIPYLYWATILLGGMLFGQHKLTLSNFGPQWIYLVTHGSGFYFYYIIVTFQLYLIFPVLVWLFKRFNNRHGLIVGISLVIQLGLLFFIKYELPHLDTSHWPYLMRSYGLNVVVYQFYFVVGAFVSIHYQAVLKFIDRYHGKIILVTILLGIGTIGEFFFNQKVLHLSMTKTLEIHQPYVFVYDVFIIAFVFWLGILYSTHRESGLPQWFVKFIATGAKISFGIYLSQTIGLVLLQWLLAQSNFGNGVELPVSYLFVVGVSYAISYLAYKIPPFGILVGRPQWRFKQLKQKIGATAINVKD